MNSRWLEKHVEELKNVKSKGASEKKKGLLIAVVILVVMVGIALLIPDANQTRDNSNEGATAAVFAAMFLPIMCVCLMISKKGAGKDSTMPLRQELQTLLTTQEQVDQFDNEMLNAPLADFDCGGTKYAHVQFTEHYIHNSFLDFTNLPDHRFVRLSDVHEMKFAISKDDTKVMGLGKLYYVDLLDSNGKKCMGLSIHGRERMDEFEGLLQKYCPDVLLQEHTLF